MSVDLKAPPATSKAPVKSSLWAWLAMLSIVVLFPVVVVSTFSYGLDDPGDSSHTGFLVFVAILLLPFVAGVLLGVRSGRTGNRLGALAAAVGSAVITFLVVLNIAATYVWTGKSGDSGFSEALATILALVVFGAVEAVFHRHWKRPT